MAKGGTVEQSLRKRGPGSRGEVGVVDLSKSGSGEKECG